MAAPWNVPAPGATPTMDMDSLPTTSRSSHGEQGRQPTYEEYAQIMQAYTPEQVPVLNGLAREFGVFDHWFCRGGPPQTFMNRSFWTAATCTPLPTGGTINTPSRTGSTTTRRRRSSTGSRPTARRGRSTRRSRAQRRSPGWIHAPPNRQVRDELRAVRAVQDRCSERDTAGLRSSSRTFRRPWRLPSRVRAGRSSRVPRCPTLILRRRSLLARRSSTRSSPRTGA